MQNPLIPSPPKLVQTVNQNNSIQKDIIYFKEDVLKDMRRIDAKLKLKMDSNTEILEQKLKAYDTKLDSMTQKIAELSKMISTDNAIHEKVDQLSAYRATVESTLITHEVKQNMISKELKDAIFKYDKVIIDNLLYPGVIGNSCKFKNFKEFIDYLLKQDSLFITFRDKQILDLRQYKVKLESLSKQIQAQLDAINLSTSQYTNRAVSDCEERIKNTFKIYDDRLEDMRVENVKYAVQLKNQSQNLASEWIKVMNIKNDIYAKFESEVQEMKNSNFGVLKSFDGYKKEFKLIKNRFTQLSEFIKDVRFRINGGHLKKKDANKMGNLIDFDKKQVLKEEEEPKKNSTNHPRGSMIVESFLKKYIKGEVDANTVMNQRDIRKSLGSLNNFPHGGDSAKNSNRNTDIIPLVKENALRKSSINHIGHNLLEEFDVDNKSLKYINRSLSISNKKFLDDGDSFANHLQSGTSSAKHRKYSKQLNDDDDSLYSSSVKNSVINEEENDLYSNPQTNLNNNNSKEENDKEKKNEVKEEAEDIKAKTQIVSPKVNKDLTELTKVNDNPMKQKEENPMYTLPEMTQNKSYTLLPSINNQNISKQNVKTVSSISQKNNILSYNNKQNTLNSFRKAELTKKNASKSQDNIFTNNIHSKGRSAQRSPEKTLEKKSTINQLEEYIEEIKVYIPNTGLESDSNPYASDHGMKGKTIQMNNIAIYNNYNNKLKSNLKKKQIKSMNTTARNPMFYNANEQREASNNYYYNMMVNEDKGLHYSSLSKVLTNEPKTLPNTNNSVLLKNKKNTYYYQN